MIVLGPHMEIRAPPFRKKNAFEIFPLNWKIIFEKNIIPEKITMHKKIR